MALGVELRRLQPNDGSTAHARGQLLQFQIRSLALHRGERAARHEEVPARADELRELGEGTRDYDRKERRWTPGLDAAFVYFDVLHSELDRCLPQKRRLFLIGFDQRDAPLRARKRERDPGK